MTEAEGRKGLDSVVVKAALLWCLLNFTLSPHDLQSNIK